MKENYVEVPWSQLTTENVKTEWKIALVVCG